MELVKANFMSISLGHKVPRYLLKYYSGHLFLWGWLWMRLTSKLVYEVIQTIEDLNRTKKAAPPWVRESSSCPIPLKWGHGLFFFLFLAFRRKLKHCFFWDHLQSPDWNHSISSPGLQLPTHPVDLRTCQPPASIIIKSRISLRYIFIYLESYMFFMNPWGNFHWG